jgi:polyhydroxyalkanoate synthase subunit PhaC
MSEPTFFSNPWLQWQEALQAQAASAMKNATVLPSFWSRVQQIRKGATPSEVVYEEDRLKLLHYEGAAPPRYQTPLLLVYALVNRPYILDLKAGRSVVAHFVERGFDTYLVDWGVPTHADRHLTLDDYINGYLQNVVGYLCERTGAPQASLLGYCMGGTMSAMFTALHSKQVKNLMLLAAPIDFSTSEGLLNLWSRGGYFDADKFVDAFGNCPAEFLQATFRLLRPVDNLIRKPLNVYEHLGDEKFLDDFLTTETWLNDNIPIPGEVYREFVKYLYQKNMLTQNRMPVGKHIVNLQQITCPVLNIMASEDDLVPCAQGMPFNSLVASKDRKTLLLKGSGHIGLAIGGRAQREVWPEACAWLAQRSQPAATGKKASTSKPPVGNR